MPSWATVGTIAAVYGVDTYVRDMRRIATETSRTGLAVSAATRAMNSNVFSGVGKSLASVGSQINRIGNNISSLGFAWTTTFGAMAAAGAFATIRLGSEFEQTMNRIVALTGTSRAAVDAWAQAILRLAPELGRMPTELANSLYFIKSIGIKDVATELELLRQSSMAASLGMGEIESITKSVVSIFKVYGKEGYDIREVTNALLVTVRLAAFEADGLATSFARVLPVGAAVGANLSGMLGYMAGVSRLGMTASQAATSLQNALNFLADPTAEAKNALDEFNMSIDGVRDAVEGEAGLQSVLLILAETMGKDVSRLFTNRATAGVLGLSSISDEYRQITAEIEASLNLQKGQLSELELAFKDYTSTINFAWEATRAGLASVSIQLFQALKAPLADILLKLVGYLQAIQLIIYNNPILAATILKVVAAAALLGPALIVAGALIRSLGNVLTLLSVPFSMFGAGISLVATGVGSLARALAGPLLYSATALGNVIGNTATTFTLFFRSLLAGRGITATLTQSFAHLARMISGLTAVDYARNRFLLFGRSIIFVNTLFIRLLSTISTMGFAVPALVASITKQISGLSIAARASGGVFALMSARITGAYTAMVARITSTALVGRLVTIWGTAFAAIRGSLFALSLFAVQRVHFIRDTIFRIFPSLAVAISYPFTTLRILTARGAAAVASFARTVQTLMVRAAMFIVGGLRGIFAGFIQAVTSMFWPAFSLIRGMGAATLTMFRAMFWPALSLIGGMISGIVGMFSTLLGFLRVMASQVVMLMVRLSASMIGPLLTTVWNVISITMGAVLQSILALVPVVISALGTAIGALSGLAAAIFSIASPIVAVGAAVAGAILLITSIAGAVKNMFGRIRTVAARQTPSLAGDMRGYGKNIIESFSRGMIDGLIAVVQALRYIASVVRAWLRPGSPPKILPDLDIWGAGAMAAYMEGWTNIDFSAFNEISSKFRAFFTSLLDFDAGADEQAGIIGRLVGFRDILATALNDIDAVGYVSDSIWSSVNAGLQGASLEMQNYVRLTLQAAQAQERVKAIQDEIARLQEATNARLKPFNDRLAEIAGIREEVQGDDRIEELERIIANPRSSERARMLARLEIEEISINREVDAIKAEVDPQLEALNAQLTEAQAQSEILARQAENAQAVLELQIEQNELLREQLRLLQEAADEDGGGGGGEDGAGAGAGGLGGGGFPDIGEAGGIGEGLEDFGELGIAGPLGDLDSKLQELKDEIGGLASELGGLFSEIGTRLRDWWDGTGRPIFDSVVNHPFVQEIWTTLRETVGKVVERFNEMKPSLDSVKGGLSSLMPIVQGIGLVILALVSGLSGFIVNMAGIFGSVMTRLTELKPAIDQIVLGIGNMIRGLLLLFGGGEGGWELLGQGFGEFISGIGLMLEGLILAVLDIGARIGAALIQLLIDIGLRLLTGFEEMTGISTEKIRLWLEDKKAKLEEFLTYGGNWGTELKNRVVAAWEELRSNVAAKIESMRSTVEQKTSGIRELFIRVEERLAGTREKFRELQEKVSNFITLLTALILEKFFGVDVKAKDLGSTIDVLRVGFEEFKRLVGIAITKLKEGFEEQLGFIKGILESVFVIGLELWKRLADEFRDDVIRIFEGIKEGINTAISVVISILDSWLNTLIGIFDWLNTHIFRIVTEEETREPSVNTGGGGSGGSGGGGGDGPVIRATGGPVRSGRPYLVGELGPELFMPSRNGQIIPNHRLAQMASGPMVRGGQVAAHIDNRESVVNFGDTYVSNGMDAATFEARIRAVVIKMMK